MKSQFKCEQCNPPCLLIINGSMELPCNCPYEDSSHVWFRVEESSSAKNDSAELPKGYLRVKSKKH